MVRGMSSSRSLEIAGREVAITNPDKLVFPEAGHTKLDLVNYYLAVADGALRGVAGRPMILKRFVKGIDQEAFFQKRAPDKRPDWIEVAELHYASGRSAEEVVVRDAAALAWVVNLGCIDLNPHPVLAEDLDHPDELRIDLDPMPGVDWEQIVDVALVAKEVLDDHGLDRLAEDLRLARLPHLRADRAAVVLPRRAAGRRDGRPRGREPRARPGHQPVVEGGAGRASSSTSTRTPRTARSPPPTRCARRRTPASPRRWPGTRCPTASPEDFTLGTVLEPVRGDRRPVARASTASAGSLDAAARPGRSAWARPRSRPRAGRRQSDDAADRDRPGEDQGRGAGRA